MLMLFLGLDPGWDERKTKGFKEKSSTIFLSVFPFYRQIESQKLHSSINLIERRKADFCKIVVNSCILLLSSIFIIQEKWKIVSP